MLQNSAEPDSRGQNSLKRPRSENRMNDGDEVDGDSGSGGGGGAEASVTSSNSFKAARFEGRHMPQSFHELLCNTSKSTNAAVATTTAAWDTTSGREGQNRSVNPSTSTHPGDGEGAASTFGYPLPDETPDVEDTIKGHEDYNDLSPGRRAALRASVKQLCDKVLQARSRGGNPSTREGGTNNQEKKKKHGRDDRSNEEASSNSAGAGVGYCGVSASQLEHWRVRAARLPGFKDTARKSELTAAYRELVREGAVPSVAEVEQLFVRKRGKSHSGVLVITVLMGPSEFSCPKDCHYCPNQPGVARSYLLKEPAVLRGFRNGWDPVAQFYDRASALEGNGHVVDKIELIILGGTFSFYPAAYAEQFIAGCFYAANTYYHHSVDDAKKVDGGEDASTTTTTTTIPGGKKGGPRAIRDIGSEITENETARCRIIGVTIETRPDYINARELRRLRTLGVTRVQLGIQHLDDDILRLINRDCPTRKTVIAIQRLLDAGFKVDAHWMPDLPGSSYEKDLEMFQTLLDDESNENFQVDQWKVYPTATVPYTKISEWYEEGRYKPYAEIDNGALMAKLLLYIVTHAPYRLRLNRIVRDIPTTYIKGGERRVNLRQDLDRQVQSDPELQCRDIRTRECKQSQVRAEDLHLFVDTHRASQGTEYYISMENQNRTQLYGHLRLRVRDDVEDEERCVLPVLKGAALIRELHTYGTLIAVHQHHPAPPHVTGTEQSSASASSSDAPASAPPPSASSSSSAPPPSAQHRGIGSRLMREAERLAQERHHLKKFVVIAGVGARGYYAKLGYRLEETYMVKYAEENPATCSDANEEEDDNNNNNSRGGAAPLWKRMWNAIS